MAVLCQSVALPAGAFAPDGHRMWVVAQNLRVLLARLVLSSEKKDWLFVPDPRRECSSNFAPKYCSPVQLDGFKFINPKYEASYRIVVGQECPSLRNRLLSFRNDASKLAELRATDPGNMSELHAIAPHFSVDILQVMADGQNEIFNPGNPRKFTSKYYIGLVHDVFVDCGAGKVVLHLRFSK